MFTLFFVVVRKGYGLPTSYRNVDVVSLHVYTYIFPAVCSPDCVFGRCSSPGVCSCDEGYEGGVCDSGGRRTVESSLYVVMAGILGLVVMTVM